MRGARRNALVNARMILRADVSSVGERRHERRGRGLAVQSRRTRLRVASTRAQKLASVKAGVVLALVGM